MLEARGFEIVETIAKVETIARVETIVKVETIMKVETIEIARNECSVSDS